MFAYIIRRLLLVVPTLFGIITINFVIVQFAPGGPVERMIAQLTGLDEGATSRISGSGGDFAGGDDLLDQSFEAASASSRYRGAQGLDPAFIAELEAQFGLDKPAHERFFIMIRDYIQFDLGESFYRDKYMRYPKPDGGDGGKGGDVIVQASRSIQTLLDFKFRQHHKAKKGGHASSKGKKLGFNR